MRFFVIVLFAVAAQAEFLDLRIHLELTDCVSCAESLQGRLERMRGVEAVELDLAASSVHLVLAPGNKVRMGPLRARVTQDGTKIAGIEAVCRCEIIDADGSPAVRPVDLTQALALAGAEQRPAGSIGVATGRIEGDSFAINKWEPDHAGQ